jgi:uncharacterized protein YgbK (DUF1537 family)
MTHSHLVDILQAQTQRKVALLNHQMIEQGAAVLRACVAELSDSGCVRPGGLSNYRARCRR